MPEFGKVLVFVGILLVVVGLAFIYGDRIPFLRFGRLPGDIVYRRGNFTFYFPLITSVVLSLLLTLVFWIIGRR